MNYDGIENSVAFILKNFTNQRIIKNQTMGINSTYFLIPKSFEYLYSRGSNSLLFDLSSPEYSSMLLGKLCGYYEDSDHFILKGRKSGVELPNSNESLDKTIENLLSMGFELPKIEEKSFMVSGQKIYVTILPNLTQGGYQVQDAHNFDFSQISNGNQLEDEFNGSVEKILSNCNSSYNLRLHGHFDLGPRGAVEHIFMIQYKPGKEGKLIPVDLDHLAITQNN